MTIEVKQITKDLVRINNGIYTTLRCTRCGNNLPLFVYECPYCTPKPSEGEK